jgi:hypothetical protein
LLIVFTAPMASATGVMPSSKGIIFSLCGTVTFAPAYSSPRIIFTASPKRADSIGIAS